MSIQVPSPSYGSVAGGDAGPWKPDPADPGAPVPEEEPEAGPLADPTTSGELVHAASPIRQSSAHARARDHRTHAPSPAAPVPENRESPDPPKVLFRSAAGLNWSGSVRIAGGCGRAR